MEPGWSIDFVHSVGLDLDKVSCSISLGNSANNIVENSEFTRICKLAWDSLLDKPDPKPFPTLFDLAIECIKSNQINYNLEDIPNECHIAIQATTTHQTTQ